MKTTEFIAYLKARGCSPDTLKAYTSDLRKFEQFLRAKKLRVTAVTPRILQEYANQMTNPKDASAPKSAPSSVWRRLATVSTYYEFLRLQTDGKVHNPVKAVARPRVRRGSPKAIDAEALKTLFSGITDLRDRALVMLLVSSGLRLSEVHQLNLNSIKVERKQMPDGTLRVLGAGTVVGKGGRERAFLIDVSALDAIADYVRSRVQDSCEALFISNRGKRLSRREIQHIFRKWCRRLGLADYHVHCCRHSFAERLANAGISSLALQELMGHASFSTTQGYFRLKRQRLASEYFAAMELASGAR